RLHRRLRAPRDLARDEVAELIGRREPAVDDHLRERLGARELRLDIAAFGELFGREHPIAHDETRELLVLRACPKETSPRRGQAADKYCSPAPSSQGPRA